MVTIRQIAKLARLSVGTVSQALRGNPCVKPATRERVQALAAQLHYRGSPRPHRRRCTSTGDVLAVILPDISNHYYARVLRGVLQSAYKVQWQVQIYEVASDDTLLDAALTTCLEQQVTGVLLKVHFPQCLPPDALEALRAGSARGGHRYARLSGPRPGAD
jgi:DNA-binding LacI/PurR family transcriptional regulator